MEIPTKLLQTLETCEFKVSTDTRRDLQGSVYFGLKGETFDGNTFVHEALKNGAVAAVTDSPTITGENIYQVNNSLETLQSVANIYRKKFDIPVIAIGGSNGKTTSKELLREVLKTKYQLHATTENLNNHIGVPLSILMMKRGVELGIFEIGANHPQEHMALLEILEPTIVVVTNNGLDHLEGFGSPAGVRLANKEIYDWALSHQRTAFVNKNHADLMEDSAQLERIIFPDLKLDVVKSLPLTLMYEGKEYTTNMAGDYNLENIHLALSIANHFKIDTHTALQAISEYRPSSKRSEFVTKNGINFIVDCYNANPSSMGLALESFIKSTQAPRGVILGDMLELGQYSDNEHLKIVEYVSKQDLDHVVFVGENFKKMLGQTNFSHEWFPNSEEAREWLRGKDFYGYIFLLKGSRGIKIEKVLEI